MVEEPSQAALEESRRLAEEEAASVHTRYRKRFRVGPPQMAWTGSDAELERLMEEAIARGRKLEPEELADLPPHGEPW